MLQCHSPKSTGELRTQYSRTRTGTWYGARLLASVLAIYVFSSPPLAVDAPVDTTVRAYNDAAPPSSEPACARARAVAAAEVLHADHGQLGTDEQRCRAKAERARQRTRRAPAPVE